MTRISSDHFSTEHLQADLKGRSVSGGVITFASQGAGFVLRVGSLAVLGRLLTPADFGLIAMVAAVTGFVTMFKDAGLSMATIQREQINHSQISTLFWINIALSIAVMGIVAVLAPLVAWFYGEPRLINVTLAFAGIFLLGGLTIQHQALLRRQMRFGVLAIIGIISMTAGVAAAIIAAVMGLGYWALVIQMAVAAAVNAGCVWIACDWRPGRPVRHSGVRSMLAFGGNLTGFNFLNYFARNADNVLIGWYWGAGPLGFYSKAYQLLMLPIQQVNNPMSAVALPALSRLQNDPERFKRYYYKAIGLMAFVGMPVVVFLFVEARGVVLFILGDQWLPAVPIFRALAVAAFLGTFNVATGWVYAALGRTDRQLKWFAIVSPLVIVAFLCGLPWGALGVAIGFSLSVAILRLPGLWFCYYRTFLRVQEILRILIRPAISSVAAGIGLWGFKMCWEGNWIGEPIVAFVTYVGLYILSWMIIPGGRQEILVICRLLNSIWRRQQEKHTSPSVSVLHR